MRSELECSEAAIVNRVIQPESGDWPQTAAEAILGMGFHKTDREHMTDLLEKAETRNLTDDESEVLENYRHIGKLLELMKSRARHSWVELYVSFGLSEKFISNLFPRDQLDCACIDLSQPSLDLLRPRGFNIGLGIWIECLHSNSSCLILVQA
jgi:hypothetical protein